MTWLAQRAAYQMPDREANSQQAPSLTAIAYDVRSGAAESVIKGFVEANAGQTALSYRRRLTVTPAGGAPIGSTVKGKARMQPTLLELIRGLAATGGIGFRVLQSGTKLPFDTYVPSDLTSLVRFSVAFHNLTEFEYTESAPTAAFVIAGASGNGTTRTFASMLDGEALVRWPSWRFEKYIDQNQTIDGAELAQAMAEELLSNGPKKTVSISTRDTPQIRFAIDYFVGDKATVELPSFGGVTTVIKDVIREVTVDWSAGSGASVVTQIGSSETTGTNLIAERLRKIRKIISDVNTVD